MSGAAGDVVVTSYVDDPGRRASRIQLKYNGHRRGAQDQERGEQAVAVVIREIKTQNRLLLTGTPPEQPPRALGPPQLHHQRSSAAPTIDECSTQLPGATTACGQTHGVLKPSSSDVSR